VPLLLLLKIENKKKHTSRFFYNIYINVRFSMAGAVEKDEELRSVYYSFDDKERAREGKERKALQFQGVFFFFIKIFRFLFIYNF
jgi:hypothetical protein